jgi:hypothetical protein
MLRSPLTLVTPSVLARVSEACRTRPPDRRSNTPRRICNVSTQAAQSDLNARVAVSAQLATQNSHAAWRCARRAHHDPTEPRQSAAARCS